MRVRSTSGTNVDSLFECLAEGDASRLSVLVEYSVMWVVVRRIASGRKRLVLSQHPNKPQSHHNLICASLLASKMLAALDHATA